MLGWGSGGLGDLLFVIAGFAAAETHGPGSLRRPLDDEGSVTDRAAFRQGPIPERVIAIRIIGAPVKCAPSPRFPLDDLAAAVLRT